MQPLPFGSYRRNVPGDAQRLVNCFAEQAGIGAKSRFTLLRSPGVRTHKDAGAGPGRGLGLHKGNLYAVSGNKLYRVPTLGAAGNAVEIGSVPGTARVSMRSNSIDLGIVSKPHFYASDGVTVTQITDAAYVDRGSLGLEFMDGYWLFQEPLSGRHFSSNLYSRVFDALKFATAELKPDNLVGQSVNQRQWAHFGEQSVELWYDSGADNYPFEKMSGGDLEIGCLGGITVQDNAEHFLANDKTYRRLNGQTAQKVSHHGVDEHFGKYLNPETAYAFPCAIEGHLYVVVTFPEQATWLLDASSGEWHERQSYGRADWRVCDAIEIKGVWYVQDVVTGKVGILDAACYDEWGQTLIATWTYPSIWNSGGDVFHNALELLAKPGVGLVTGQGEDPTVMLRISNDGGMTFFQGPSRKLGKIGKYETRAFWTSLGKARDRVYEMSVSDPVQLAIYSTRYATEPGDD